METAVECTHCGVVMTSWSAPGSQIRYYQCPFCARTHSSLYGEVFRRRAGARVLETPPRSAPPSAIPMASQDEVRWARIKASAARWFARLDADERRLGSRAVARPARAVPSADVPEVAPEDVIEISPMAAGGRPSGLRATRALAPARRSRPWGSRPAGR